MKWIRAAAVLASTLAASYAWAAPPEARLGGAVPSVAGAPSRATAGVKLPDASGLAVGRALSRLHPEGRATTRGGAEIAVYKRGAPAVPLIVTKEAFGSGVLISADGQIITNLHVVGDAKEVGVIFKPAIEGAAVDKADMLRAKVLRRDEVADLALIKVESVPAGVTPLTLGNSTTVQVGADVHAIGHPTGETWTYTRGIVSQIRRAYAWHAEDKLEHEATVIQTQTPINPGNSGGPLLDDQLNVIGINSFKSDGEGLNFAVSAEDVKSFLARSDDRVVRTAEASGKACELTILDEQPNADPKGTFYRLDADCDGKADGSMVKPTSRREPISLFFDDDGDGEYDTMYLDNNHDGNWDDALFDTDGNGKPDMRGWIRKGEDEPYKWEKIAE